MKLFTTLTPLRLLPLSALAFLVGCEPPPPKDPLVQSYVYLPAPVEKCCQRMDDFTILVVKRKVTLPPAPRKPGEPKKPEPPKVIEVPTVAPPDKMAPNSEAFGKQGYITNGIEGGYAFGGGVGELKIAAPRQMVMELSYHLIPEAMNHPFEALCSGQCPAPRTFDPAAYGGFAQKYRKAYWDARAKGTEQGECEAHFLRNHLIGMLKIRIMFEQDGPGKKAFEKELETLKKGMDGMPKPSK
jgi:hypothetical protein